MVEKHIPFHLKYRPTNFNNVIGHNKITKYLTSSIKKNKISFAYLITGQHGSGKTTIAKIMAKAINCKNSLAIPCNACENCLNINLNKCFDFYEIDAAKNTGIDNIREIIENIQFAPITSKYKVCIIDEVHMLSHHAFNSLLKTLEFPPDNTVFILLTTSIHKIPNTIISRCQKIFLPRIRSEDFILYIAKIVYLENLKITNKGLNKILDLANGSLRDALNIIESFIINKDVISLHSLQNRYLFPSSSIVKNLVENILMFNLINVLNIIDYIEKRYSHFAEINNIIYSFLINKYKSKNKFDYYNDSLFVSTELFIKLLKILAEYKYYQSHNQWSYIIFFILSNNTKKLKIQKNKNKKSIKFYIENNRIYSN